LLPVARNAPRQPIASAARLLRATLATERRTDAI
jgi:hypothetical protein